MLSEDVIHGEDFCGFFNWFCGYGTRFVKEGRKAVPVKLKSSSTGTEGLKARDKVAFVGSVVVVCFYNLSVFVFEDVATSQAGGGTLSRCDEAS